MAQKTYESVPESTVSGLVRTPDGRWTPGQVWLAGGKVSAVLTGSPHVPAGARHLDFPGSFLLPGVIDAHMHCYSYAGEGIQVGTASAAAGGVTTVVEMPYDAPGPINSVERLTAKQELVGEQAVIDVALLGTLAPGGGWREAAALVEHGVVGFKISLFNTDPRRFPRIDNAELLDVMAAIAGTGVTVCVHAEDNEIIHALSGTDQAKSSTDPHTHGRVRPPVSETLGVLTALETAADKGTKVHVCHVTLPHSVDLVDWYRTQGFDASTETCPHYLTFTDPDMDRLGTRIKINPPVRTPQAREGMWQRLADGRLPIVSSDHAPWPLELKTVTPVLDNKSGVPSVETMLTVVLGQALQRDPSLALFNRAVDAMTSTPAARFGIADRKGSLASGMDADLVVFTPDTAGQEPYRIDGSALHSNAGWSPYDGMTPGGHVALTISRGEVVWDAASGQLGAPGRGQLITRSDLR